MRKIVLGLDGSDGAAAALHWAVHEAAVHGASIDATYAWNVVGQAMNALAPGLDQGDALVALRHWLESVPTTADVTPVVGLGAPAAVLVDASAAADLVVVGSRGRGGFAELLLGSTSSAVAERALCPVAVIRETSHHPLGPIVAGVDGPAQGYRSLRWAADEARARDVSLELVHAWSGTPAPVYGRPVPLPLPHLEEAAEHELTDAMAAVDLAGLAVHRHVVEATPAGALVRMSETASVVVVGSRGRGGLTSILLGSISRHLLHHAHCPVVVVR